MKKTVLGRTGLTVSRTGFGALPIQRVSFQEAEVIINRAYEAGITYFDTARFYTDSEAKLGRTLGARRKNVVIASKIMSDGGDDFTEKLEVSLKELDTDYIDIQQFHCAPITPKPDDGSGLYEAMLKARRAGKIRFIGLTAHRLEVAMEAVACGLYDVVQFTLNYLSPPRDLALIAQARKKNVSLTAMKPISGGLLSSMSAAFAFLRQYENVIPLWGVQKLEELNEFLAYEENPPALTPELQKIINTDRVELAGDFCRGCGYCLPCPADIEINNAARMGLLLKRAPVALYTTPEWRQKMELIDECLECGNCAERCPYELNAPELLKKTLAFYREFVVNYDACGDKRLLVGTQKM